MNEMASPPPRRKPTQAAEGLPRWHWTTAELERLERAGVFTEYDRFELIGGEIVPMSPKGNRHEIVRTYIAFHFSKLASNGVFVSSEPQLNLADDLYLNPDVLVHPVEIQSPFVRGDTALLVVEVADTSLDYDLSTKAAIYAAHGVREYWAIDTERLVTLVHSQPGAEGFAALREVVASDTLTATLAPELTLRLADIRLS